MKVLASIGVLLGLLAWAAFAEADKKPDPQAKLETAVPEAIRLLEAKEYASFLKAFVPPEDLKRITEKAPLEEFAKNFAEKKAARLLEMLKAIQDVKPELNEEGSEATFEAKEEIGGKKKLGFLKIDKRWYIKN